MKERRTKTGQKVLGAIAKLARGAAPVLSQMMRWGVLAKGTAAFESYIAFLQGKGSGSGWDLDGEVRAAISCIHRPDPVVFDVGASRGEWSARFLEALKSSGTRIFLFEPQPLCQEFIESRRLPNATLIKAAVSDRSGRALFHSPHPASERSSLFVRRDSWLDCPAPAEEEVEVVTVDEVIARFGLDRVDFMKVDVEGAEVAVLRGAQRALEAGRIRALAFEFSSANVYSRTYFRDYWDILAPLGYVIRRIGPGGVLFRVERYHEALEYFRGATNYLATLGDELATPQTGARI